MPCPAFLIALALMLIKIVFLLQPFIPSAILLMSGTGAGSLVLFFFYGVKDEVFQKPKNFRAAVLAPLVAGRTATLFGSVLFAIALFFSTVPQVGIISAMLGVQYAFLYIFAYGVSRWKPELLKEDISGPAIAQKSGVLK